MFKFLFGIVWNVFATLIFIFYLVVSREQSGGMEMSPLFFILFELIGLYFIIIGLIKIKKDSETKKYGTICYAFVNDIQKTGSSVNNNPEYKAILNFVNPVTHQLEFIEEIIGFERNKYPINSYILCKYYQGDINLENLISENEVPYDIRKQLVPKQQDINYSNIEFSSNKDM